MDMKRIGKRIREKRIEKGWRQEDLAEKINLTADYIGMIERGEKTPRLETLINIINCLNVSSDEILMDVIDKGYLIRTSKYAELIGGLKEKDRERLYRIIEAYLE